MSLGLLLASAFYYAHQSYMYVIFFILCTDKMLQQSFYMYLFASTCFFHTFISIYLPFIYIFSGIYQPYLYGFTYCEFLMFSFLAR